MDFYYMNRNYAKHKYHRDSKPEKLIRYVWNHLLRFQDIDRVKLLAILVGLKVAYDNDVDDIRTRVYTDTDCKDVTQAAQAIH